MSHPALEPGRIGPVELRNRIVKTATFEGMTPGGRVSDELIALHRDMAARGVALTTVAYGAVEERGRARRFRAGPSSRFEGLHRRDHFLRSAGRNLVTCFISNLIDVVPNRFGAHHV